MVRPNDPIVQRVVDARPDKRVQESRITQPLNAARFVILGEGLAAGMTNFSLIEDDQRDSFGAQLARQLGMAFPQPLLQSPGLGDAPGFRKIPVMVPYDQQTTVLAEFPPAGPFANV